MRLLTRFPLRLTIPLFLFLLLVLASGYTMVYSRHLADVEEEHKALALVTQHMSHRQDEVDYYLRKGDRERVLAAIARDGANLNVVEEVLVDDTKTIIASTDLTWLAQSIGQVLPNAQDMHLGEVTRTLIGRVSLSDDRQTVSAYYPVILGTRKGEIRPDRVGVLYLRYDLASAKAIRRQGLERQMLVMAGFYAGCFVLLGLFLHQIITTRVNDLATAARRIAAGDLSARADLRGEDELAQIGQDFDRMAGAIAANQSALKRLNRELSAIRNCNQALLRADEELPLLEDICDIIRDEAGYRAAWVGFAEQDVAKSVRVAAASGIETALLAQFGFTWAGTARGRLPSGTAIRDGVTVLVNDVASDPRVALWRDDAIHAGILSILGLPLRDSSGVPFGVLSIYASAPGAFSPEDSYLLEELAGDMAYGITALRTRAARRLAESALQEERKLFIGGPNVAFKWKMAPGWPVEYVSPNVEEQFGYRSEDFTSGKVIYANIIHPDDLARVAQEVETFIEQGVPWFEQEYRIARADGEYRWIYDFTVVVRDSNKRHTHNTGHIHDITERKRSEEERAQLLIREQAAHAEVIASREAARLKNDFINAVSHDLRTPITTIRGYAELMEDEIGGPLTDPQRRFVKQIDKSTRRLEYMVNDLLDIARSEAGTLKLDLEQVDIRATVHEVIESLQPQAVEANLGLDAVIPEEVPPLMMDPERIERVLVNLLTNAIKFTPSRGRIQIRVRVDGEWLRCEVEDSGRGIAPEDLPKLFLPFSQLDTGKQKKGGTGLGLSISKTIVEAHGGEIGVRSVVGEGSTFWFTLPLHHTTMKQGH